MEYETSILTRLFIMTRFHIYFLDHVTIKNNSLSQECLQEVVGSHLIHIPLMLLNDKLLEFDEITECDSRPISVQLSSRFQVVKGREIIVNFIEFWGQHESYSHQNINFLGMESRNLHHTLREVCHCQVHCLCPLLNYSLAVFKIVLVNCLNPIV